MVSGGVKCIAQFSFSEFVTTKIIKVLFGLAIVVGAVISIGILFGVRQGGLAALGSVVLAPLFFLLFVIYARVTLELIMVIFRIAESTAEMAKQMQKPAAPAEKQA